MATDPYALFRRREAASAPLATGRIRWDPVAALLVLFVGLTALFAPTDPDVWRHLATGRHLAAAGLPPAELFSHTAAGAPWMVQDWLTALAMAEVQAAWGYGALTIAFGALHALAAALAYALMRRHGAGRRLASGGLAAYALLTAPTWGVRPEALTPVLLGGFLLALEAHRRSPHRPGWLWLLPPAMVLWANLHPSFVLGLAAVLAYAIGEGANRAFERPVPAAPAGPLWLALAGTLGATLLTPHGTALWREPLGAVIAGAASPLAAFGLAGPPVALDQPVVLMLAAAFVGAALLAQRRASGAIDVSAALVAVGFALVAAQSVILLPVLGVATLPVLAGGLAAAYPALSAAREGQAGRTDDFRRRALAAVAACALVTASLAAPDAQLASMPRAEARGAYPAAAARVVEALPAPRRLFNERAWGGYLMASVPSHRIFIDERDHVYRGRVADDYAAITGLLPGWRTRLGRYGIDTVLIRANGPLDEALAHEPGWRELYRDGVAVVYRQ